MDVIIAFLFPTLLYAYIFILNAVMPGRWVVGYATKPDSEEKLKYRLNGIWVLIAVLITWFVLCRYGFMEWDYMYNYRWETLAGAITLGLIFTLIIVLKYPKVKNNFFADFYLGRAENPQLWGGRIDAKMWLYLIGAIVLALNVLSFCAHHYILYGVNGSIGIYLSTSLLMFFIFDYLTFEEVHLYTYDLFAERVGFKLGWGCIAFYPFFYTIHLWNTVDLPSSNTPTLLLIIYALIFFIGWCISRGANLQKYYFKRDPNKVFLGITPEVISDGKKKLLVNGFWGLSRHINYLGEILMATGIILCVGFPMMLTPWMYPLYYVALLFPRQIDDDARCAHKYGSLWDEYLTRVKYRIIPFIY